MRRKAGVNRGRWDWLRVKGKRGSDMVEAAMVLPVLILVILSLILLMIYDYHCVICQTDLHADLLAKAEKSLKIYDTLEENRQVCESMGGLSEILMKKRIAARCYVFAPAAILRAGELVGLD